MGYPPEQFAALLPALDPVVGAILLDLLGLLAKLTAHAATSGHTPPTLSPLFGPLLFGLGAPGLAFAHTYAAYLRATHGAEHVPRRVGTAVSGRRRARARARVRCACSPVRGRLRVGCARVYIHDAGESFRARSSARA
jgi:hypothetical protein